MKLNFSVQILHFILIKNCERHEVFLPSDIPGYPATIHGKHKTSESEIKDSISWTSW
jgi:hypothetical protein